MAKFYDQTQQRVIDANDEYNLVLAPPGCGKTEILAQRIIKAHQSGVAFSDMLCLTFTNRAARGMVDRIKQTISDPEISDLFVGNIHRFCNKFLADNDLLPKDVTIIDDLEIDQILDEYGFTKAAGEYCDNIFLTKTDFRKAILSCAHICRQTHLGHPAEAFIYTTVQYPNNPKNNTWNEAVRNVINGIAEQYNAYKSKYMSMDFDDILISAYTFMMAPDYKSRYIGADFKWIQVDEAQDLNPMQHAIIDKILSEKDRTIMYLGDEQQAIFSFQGAKLSSLDSIKKKTGGKILRLESNYRSPKYLLDIFNTYAEKQLGVDKAYLPKAVNSEQPEKGAVGFFESKDPTDETDRIARATKKLLSLHPNDRVAVVVRSNAAADSICGLLSEKNVPHFRLSGKDTFKTVTYKTLLSHFNVSSRVTSYMEWARLLFATKATLSFTDARELTTRLRGAGMTPEDFILRPNSSYLKDFVRSYQNKEIVIFDTETTGVNVYEDDIIQIAAIKVRNGVIVSGSEYNVILRTDKSIPAMLGNTPNPMVELYEKSEKLDRAKVLEDFLDYVGSDEVLGHNVSFDMEILRNNVLRNCPHRNVYGPIKTSWDSLKLAKLITPRIRSYKLVDLLVSLNLSGENSHMANDDILATKSLVDYCFNAALYKIKEQDAIMSEKQNIEVAEAFRTNYRDLYLHTLSVLDEADKEGGETAMVKEMRYIYNRMVDAKYVKTEERIEYIFNFLDNYVTYAGKAHHVRTELQNHLIELSTFSESDLCDSNVIKEKVYVMTVHKAKGLEFESVIIQGVIDGAYPFFRCKSAEQIMEDSRVLYVALSRARKRLYISYYWKQKTKYDRVVDKRLSPFMDSIQSFFTR